MTLQTKTYPYKLARGMFFIFYFCFFCYLPFVNASEGWQQLTDGIEYKDLSGGILTPWSHIHVFRIDLAKNRLGVVTAKSLSLSKASVNEYAHFSKALLAINGGFFDRNHHPLGLRISENDQKNPLKRISWWGIFYIKNGQPFIKKASHFYRDKAIDFAIQSGPRLIVNNKIPSLKDGTAERTALGITKDKKVIVLVTDNSSMTTTELAQIMISPTLSCTDALNLDGGKSTQLYANINSFKLSVQGYSDISDAVIIKAR